MITKSETLIITAALALAMVPRYEAKVEQFVKTHRVEIRMAMNELQGKPAIPFAAPEAAPAMETAPAAEEARQLASMIEEDDSMQEAETAQAREVAVRANELNARLAMLGPQIKAATRIELARLQPALDHLPMVSAEYRGAYKVYRVKAKRCPLAPMPPAIPAVGSFTIETGSLP
jgi:hypothetical protein